MQYLEDQRRRVARFGHLLEFGLDMQNNCWLLLGKFDLDALVLTCGVNGSYVFTKGNVSYQETPKVEVADTVGAGRFFHGGFCRRLVES